MATLDDLMRPETFEALKPIGKRLGAVRAELEQGVVVIKTVYGGSVELGRGATVKQAVRDVFENAAKSTEQT